MNCPQCQSTLLVEVFGTSNPIRCASCGDISMPPNEQASEVHRDSRRSLWLGVASIVLLFLTGFPAIWYGVRSLLKMRFVRSQRGDRKAATIGTVLGLIFGIFGLAFVCVAGGFALLVMLAQKDIENGTSNPLHMAQILGAIGTVEVPDGFRLNEATRLPSGHREVIWQDGFDAEDIAGRILLVKTPARLEKLRKSCSLCPRSINQRRPSNLARRARQPRMPEWGLESDFVLHLSFCS